MKTEPKKINLHFFAMIYFLLFFIPAALNEQKPFIKFPKLDDMFFQKMMVDVCIASGVGLVIVLITGLLTKYTKIFNDLVKNFKDILGPLTFGEVFLIASFSSLAEEYFFRGLMQEKLGIVVASVCFGLLHSGPGKKYLPWTVFALVTGFALGALYEWRGNLIVPIVVHFIVNFVNLLVLQRKKFAA